MGLSEGEAVKKELEDMKAKGDYVGILKREGEFRRRVGEVEEGIGVKEFLERAKESWEGVLGRVKRKWELEGERVGWEKMVVMVHSKERAVYGYGVEVCGMRKFRIVVR
jgi:hypothetical protein